MAVPASGVVAGGWFGAVADGTDAGGTVAGGAAGEAVPIVSRNCGEPGPPGERLPARSVWTLLMVCRPAGNGPAGVKDQVPDGDTVGPPMPVMARVPSNSVMTAPGSPDPEIVGRGSLEVASAIP
jgi:hypothetical protein